MASYKTLDNFVVYKNKLLMGVPVFQFPEDDKMKLSSRMILEYNKNANVGMNYDSTKNYIYFAALTSEVNNPKLKYTYIPTGYMHGMQWTGRLWTYIPEVFDVVDLGDGNAPVGEKKKN